MKRSGVGSVSKITLVCFVDNPFDFADEVFNSTDGLGGNVLRDLFHVLAPLLHPIPAIPGQVSLCHNDWP